MVVAVSGEVVVRGLLTKLGRGESEAVALAGEAKADLVLLDDRKARAVTEFMGLQVAGTVALLARAHRQGLLADLERTLDALGAVGFRLDAGVRAKALDLGTR